MQCPEIYFLQWPHFSAVISFVRQSRTVESSRSLDFGFNSTTGETAQVISSSAPASLSEEEQRWLTHYLLEWLWGSANFVHSGPMKGQRANYPYCPLFPLCLLPVWTVVTVLYWWAIALLFCRIQGSEVAIRDTGSPPSFLRAHILSRAETGVIWFVTEVSAPSQNRCLENVAVLTMSVITESLNTRDSKDQRLFTQNQAMSSLVLVTLG